MNILFCERLGVGTLVSESVHIYEVMSRLSRMGHNIVPLNADYAKDEGEVNANLRPSAWTRIKGSVSRSRILRPIIGEITILWSFLREIYILLSALIIIARRRGRIDIIYRRHHLFNSEYLLAKLFNIPLVKEVNGIVADETKIAKRGDRLSLWVINKIERFNMSKADRIIVVTPKLKEVLQKDYGVSEDKIIVIQNGANTDLFQPMDVKKAREKLCLNQGSNYVCFVGALYSWQGVEYLVRSAPLVLQKCPETQFLIVGDGPMKRELVELVEQVGMSDKVIFTGMVPYREVPLYINASDVCTSPKAGLKSGYSPLKLCEYMACGKPVVASRASGLEIVEDSGAGILLELGDAAALAAAIIKLLHNQELRKQMGEDGRRYVVENQSWESVAKRVTDVCQSLIGSRRDKGEQ